MQRALKEVEDHELIACLEEVESKIQGNFINNYNCSLHYISMFCIMKKKILGKIKKYVWFLLPRLSYFFPPTLNFFSQFSIINYQYMYLLYFAMYETFQNDISEIMSTMIL
jgi:hypothetical protein